MKKQGTVGCVWRHNMISLCLASQAGALALNNGLEYNTASNTGTPHRL